VREFKRGGVKKDGRGEKGGGQNKPLDEGCKQRLNLVKTVQGYT